MLDRRRLNRSHLIHYLQIVNPKTGKQIGNLVDITDEGIRIISPEALPVNQQIDLEITFPEEIHKKTRILVHSLVHWTSVDVNPDLFSSGCSISLSSPDDEQVINELISFYQDAQD